MYNGTAKRTIGQHRHVHVYSTYICSCTFTDTCSCICDYITVRYKTVTLQNGTCYKAVRVTKRYTKQYVLQNDKVTKRYALQNGTLQSSNHYKMVRYITVLVTKRYITLSCNCSPPNPWISVSCALN